MCGRIFILPSLQELKELLSSALFEDTHEGTLHSLHLGAGDLRNLPIPVDVAARDLLEFEVPGDLSVNQDLGHFTGSKDELGYQIDVVVSVSAECLRDSLIRPEFAIQLSWDNRLGIIRHDIRCFSPVLGSDWHCHLHSSRYGPCGGLSCPRRRASQRGYIPSNQFRAQ